MFLNLYSQVSDWNQGGALNRQKIIAHEVFHLEQQQLDRDPPNCGGTTSNPIPACGPVWLTEGAAETMGYRVAAARGLVDLAQEEGELAGRVRGTSLTLDSLATDAGQSQSGAWDTMHLAGDHLANVSPNGIRSFVGFWTAIGAGAAWQTAFASAFGATPAQYGAAFDAFRAAL